MKILVFPFGSSGDVHPLIGLSIALQHRGHDVEFHCCEYFQDVVEKSKVPYFELGKADDFLKLAQHPDLWNSVRAFAFLFRNGIDLIMRRQVEIIQEHAARGPTLVIASCLGFGARIACERLEIPLITVHLQPAVIYSEIDMPKLMGPLSSPRIPRLIRRAIFRLGESFGIDRPACPSVNQLRRELGLKPVRRLARWWNSPDGVLCLFPEWYASRQDDWPVKSVTTQFPLWDESAISGLDPELERFLSVGDSPIVFTPGTGNCQAAPFFQEAVGACQLLKRRGIFLTRFPEQLPRDLPETIHHSLYAPFSLLLPRCSAIVHHGGIGTVSQALRAGVPQVIMSMAHDQPDNAKRVKRLGVGDELRPKRFRADRLALKLRSLIDSKSVQSNCHAVANRFNGVEAFAEACNMIEGYL